MHTRSQKDRHTNGSGNGGPQHRRGSADGSGGVSPSQNGSGDEHDDSNGYAAPSSLATSSSSSSSSSSTATDGQGHRLDPSAYEVTWHFVTFRGCADGSVVYKFGGPDPVAKLLMVGAANWRATCWRVAEGSGTVFEGVYNSCSFGLFGHRTPKEGIVNE